MPPAAAAPSLLLFFLLSSVGTIGAADGFFAAGANAADAATSDALSSPVAHAMQRRLHAHAAAERFESK